MRGWLNQSSERMDHDPVATVGHTANGILHQSQHDVYSYEHTPLIEVEMIDKSPLEANDDDANITLSKPNNGPNLQASSTYVHCYDDLCKRMPELASNLARIMKNVPFVLKGSKIWWLLPFVIVAMIANSFEFSQAYIFSFSLLGIAPLAERLGFVTEELSAYTGSTVGGLLNATFGNATEMIISLFALQNGLIHVVQLSLLGSILSNMLLVLGCAFFSGGIVYLHRGDQTFNQATAVVNSGLLLMAVMGLLFPAVLQSTHTEVKDGLSELSLSRFTSCIMLIAYASYLYFQLKSHRDLYDRPSDTEDPVEDSEVNLSVMEAISWLAVLTLFISILSNYLVDAIQVASSSLGIPLSFISVIILPIVGNAAEHASAIMFAVKDNLDLSVAVAIGSSTQISMFVIPFCVVVGWVMGKPMDLNFQLFETAALFTTVIVVAFMLQEGKSNYFKGLMLVLCYMIVGASFFWHNVDTGKVQN